ncbi:MAG: nitroreductase family deazaflavin-dependent oxidoreductase [Sporichthyaceae bacterium]
MHDWNARVIAEFRANGGTVPSQFGGIPVLLLHHVGRTSGQVRIAPLVYQPVERGYAIFGSYGGAPTHPAWYLNLLANPEVEIEIGTGRQKVRARTVEGEARTPIWEKQKADLPQFAEYEAKTEREIPVLILEAP